jgi:hypothetical protein
MRVFAIARSEGIFDVPRKKTLDRSAGPTYDAILADVVGLVDAARHAAVRSTNAVMAATYWAIGRRIVEHEQHGAERAGYGEELIVRLSSDLQSRFGRGFGRANLFQMRSFYLTYRNILQTPPDAVWRIYSGLPENPDSVWTICRRQPCGFHRRLLPATLVALRSTIDGAQFERP